MNHNRSRRLRERAAAALRRAAAHLDAAPARSGALAPWRHYEHFPCVGLREVDASELKPWAFPAFLDNPSCPWLAALKRIYAMPLSFPASMSPETGLLVHALVRSIRPALIVETGTFLGVSTIWIAAAMAEYAEAGGEGVALHSFDDFGPIRPGPWRTESLPAGRLELVQGHIREAGLADIVRLHPGLSAQTVPEFFARRSAASADARATRTVDLAYLDADHTVDGAWADFLAVEPHLKIGGYVLLHDTYPDMCGWDGPRHILDHLHERARGTYTVADVYLAPVNYGLALLQRVG